MLIWFYLYIPGQLFIGNYRDVDKVHDMMDDIAEQQEVAREISEAISNPVAFGQDIDEVSHCCSFRLQYRIPLIYLFFRMNWRGSWKNWNKKSWIMNCWMYRQLQLCHLCLLVSQLPKFRAVPYPSVPRVSYSMNFTCSNTYSQSTLYVITRSQSRRRWWRYEGTRCMGFIKWPRHIDSYYL